VQSLLLLLLPLSLLPLSLLETLLLPLSLLLLFESVQRPQVARQ
jgi:hypothetical protein